ncbi:MAG: CHAT domain-containing protein [Dyadobacter fermentans]
MLRPFLILLLLAQAVSFCFAQRSKQKQSDLQLLAECKQPRPSPARVNALLANGADPNAAEPGGGTALQWLALRGDYDSFMKLIEMGADPLRNGQLIIDEFPLGSLVTAAIYGAHYDHHDYRVLRWLAANPDIPLNKPDYFPAYNQQANTPLHAAASYGELEAMKIILAQQNQKKIDVNALCSACSGKTPLMLAAERINDPEFSLLLLQNGADVTLRDNYQLTAFDYARQFGSEKVIEVLSAYKQYVSASRYLPATIAEGFEQAAHQAISRGDSALAKTLYSKALTQTSYDLETDLLDGFEFVRLSEGLFQHLDTSFADQVTRIAAIQQKMLGNAGFDSPAALREVFSFPDSVRIDKSFERIYPMYAKLGKFFPGYKIARVEAPVYPKPKLSAIFAARTLDGLRTANHPLSENFSGDLASMEQAAYATRKQLPELYVDQLLKIARKSLIARDTANAEKYWQKTFDFAKNEWQNTAAIYFVTGQIVRGFVQVGNLQAAHSYSAENLSSVRDSFTGRIVRSMVAYSMVDRRTALDEILSEPKRHPLWQLTEALLLMAESYEDELNYATAAQYYQKAIQATEKQLSADPLFVLLCYKAAWCYFKSGNYDLFRIWQQKAHRLRIKVPLWSDNSESLEAIAMEYREHGYQLAYRSMIRVAAHFNRQQTSVPGTDRLDGDVAQSNEDLSNARAECEWLVVGGHYREALDMIQPALDKWNATSTKPITWLKLQLAKARALRGNGRESEAGELLQWLENETVRHLGIFSDLMSDVYYEQLDLLRDQSNKQAIIVKLKEIEMHQRNRQQQIPTFLLDHTEYDLYLQFNKKYIDQFTAIATEMSAYDPSMAGSLLNQAMLNKGLQLLGDRILRAQMYTTLEGFVNKLTAQTKVEIEARRNKNVSAQKEEWKKKVEDARQKTTDEFTGNYEMRKVFDELDRLFRNFAALYHQGMTGYETILAEADARYLPIALRAINRMENDLRPYFSRRWQNLQDSLKTGEALVDFVRVPMQDSVMYYALVLRSDTPGPSLVSVCPEEQVRKLLNEAAGTQVGIEALYTSSALQEMIWGNLGPALSGVRYIRYVPVGLLHRLSFDAFTPAEYTLTRLLTSQELVEKGRWMSSKGRRKISLWGGITYGGQGSRNRIARKRSEPPTGIPSRSRDSRGGPWEYLPGTATEVQTISQIARRAKEERVKTYEDLKASEEAFKSEKHLGGQFETPDVVHLATHGFFYPLKPRKWEGLPSKSNSPLTRTGLALANANLAATGLVGSGSEDGILTALEVADLNFVGSRLVVLSACETALGDIDTEEGVYGLQRAFKMAGVRYVLMSLWKVPDNETAKMMTYFYQHLMADKNFDVESAFRKTQQQMIKEHPSPYYWAGFVLTK